MRTRQGSVDQLIAYSDGLRDQGEATRADEVLVAAALARPLEAPDLLATLRRTMRALRADRVAKKLSQAPIEPRAAVTRALLDARCEPDATVLLDSICAGGDEDVIRALTVFDAPSAVSADGGTWVPRGPQPNAAAADILCLRILEGPAPRYDALLARLYETGRTAPAERAAGHLAVAQPLRAIELAAAFRGIGLSHGSESLVASVIRHTPPQTVTAVLAKLDVPARREIEESLASASMQCPDPHVLVEALRQAGAGVEADRVLLAVAERGTAPTVALLHSGLLSSDAQSDADMVVARAGRRADVADLCEMLHRGSHHRLAYLIAEQQT